MPASSPRVFKPLKFALLTLVVIVVFVAALMAVKGRFIRDAAKAYLFAYPLVTMDVTRETGADAGNRLHRARTLPDAAFRAIVRPNVDTLYAFAFLDMRDGPFVFETGENRERYELTQLLDAWTNVIASVGTRTPGPEAARYLIVGPDWHGTVPDGMTPIHTPTRIVWLLNRIQTNGTTDYPRVHDIQDQLHLVTLQQWAAHPELPGAGLAPGRDIDMQLLSGDNAKPPPFVQVQQLDSMAYFARFARLLADNPPAPDDAPMVKQLASIGIVPGQAPHWGWLDRNCARLGSLLARVGIAIKRHSSRDTVGGWWTPPMTLGRYGTDYPLRAVVAMLGFGANIPEDAVYPNAREDADGRTLNGDHRYRLHFSADQLPPVHAFWSVTAYTTGAYLIANQPRFAIHDHDPLVYNADGSLDLYISAARDDTTPAANWLPVQRGQDFELTARLYWPKPAVLNGQWHPPPIVRLD
ncbi:DUF1254 domain-containing protein [Solimonas marina]|uniref:DUF1254 domain-containing protein n=1 Tax=Solimonas marina TaxID=2714601 RepID=A0A969WA83_9GAMM|nr:DUF1254 domain-containing protein [Solimonas marina]NKF23522.1 DUF1254 domain-containing protein [Solimonas marina]